MAKKKSEKPEAPGTDDEKRGTGETARRIWLAGLGAYGKAFSEASESFKDVTGKTSEVFEELAQKGEFIEAAVSSKRKELMKKAGVPNFDFEERIAKMRSRLSGGEDAAGDLVGDMAGLEARMDQMDAKLDKILKLLSKPAKTTTTKRTTKK